MINRFTRSFVVLLLTACIYPPIGFSMGSDHPPGDLPHRDRWSGKLYETLNQDFRVHGFWVNSSDTLFYQGDAEKLNKMLQSIAAESCVELTVILHPVVGLAESPWSKKPVAKTDWSVMIGDGSVDKNPTHFRVDVWLGNGLSLQDLELPPQASIEDGGEIERFIRKHHSNKSPPITR